jgi:hypothetical protein
MNERQRNTQPHDEQKQRTCDAFDMQVFPLRYPQEKQKTTWQQTHDMTN